MNLPELVTWTALGLIAVYALQQLWLARQMRKPVPLPTPTAEPRLSILLAARNEEAHLAKTLDSLLALAYPPGRLHILIGDDASTDRTAAIARAYAGQHAHITYHYIGETWPGLRGKQNVLAQLAQQAEGEILITTDADIAVEPGWAAGLAGGFRAADVGCVSAPTLVDGPRWFDKMQAIDWLQGVSIIKAFAESGRPLTAVGNNMAVRRTAYDEVGGFEGIPFSITEDYKLFESLLEAGWAFRWLHHPSVTNRSAAVQNFRTFLRQRKRWYRGGKNGPPAAVAMVFFQVLITVLTLPFLFLLPPWAFGAYAGCKVICDGLLIATAARSIGRPDLLRHLWGYPAYFFATFSVLAIYFLLPGSVEWKGRKFS